jgi:hypothetical protein
VISPSHIQCNLGLRRDLNPYCSKNSAERDFLTNLGVNASQVAASSACL